MSQNEFLLEHPHNGSDSTNDDDEDGFANFMQEELSNFQKSHTKEAAEKACAAPPPGMENDRTATREDLQHISERLNLSGIDQNALSKIFEQHSECQQGTIPDQLRMDMQNLMSSLSRQDKDVALKLCAALHGSAFPSLRALGTELANSIKHGTRQM